MMAVLNPEGIYHCAKRGFHIQTTPLSGNHQLLLDQVASFRRGKEELGDKGKDLTLSLSRVAFAVRDDAEQDQRVQEAHDYYSRFDNVFTGPGIVDSGMIRPLPRSQTIDELADSLLIAPPDELIDRLGPYAEAGLDRVILNVNFGSGQSATLESIQIFAEEVMPHFSTNSVGSGRDETVGRDRSDSERADGINATNR